MKCTAYDLNSLFQEEFGVKVASHIWANPTLARTLY